MGCTNSRNHSNDNQTNKIAKNRSLKDLKIISIDSRIREEYMVDKRLSVNYQHINNDMSITKRKNGINTIENSNINGFINKSNTCFVAAALQCILRIQPLKDYFLSNVHIKDFKDCKSYEEKEFLYAVAEIFIGYFNTNSSALNIDRFLSQLEWIFPGYVYGEQEDAQEFLIFFFDKLHSILNRAYDASRITGKNVKLNDDVSTAWFEYLKYNNSIIVGKLKRHISRTNGNKINLQRV